MALDVVLKKMFPNLVMSMSFQKGAISGRSGNGNTRGGPVNMSLNATIPLLSICEPESVKKRNWLL